MTLGPERLGRAWRPIKWIAASALLLSAACSGAPQLPDAASRADFSAEMVDLRGRAGPPKGPEGACWQSDIRPAIIETVTDQVLISPEQRDPSGRVVNPAVYSSETRQKMLRDRGEIWFQSPCPSAMTPEFIATLQRALKARGLYLAPLTGVIDAPTAAALGRYQRSRGLDSEKLSLAAARELGLITPDWAR